MANQSLILDSCFQLFKMRFDGDTSDDKELYIRLCKGFKKLFLSTIEDLRRRHPGGKTIQCRVIEYAENTKLANYMCDVDDKFEHTQHGIEAFAEKLGIPPFGLEFQDEHGKPLIIHDYISCRKALKVRDKAMNIPKEWLNDSVKLMPCLKEGRKEVYSCYDDGDYKLIRKQAEEQFYEYLKRNNLWEDYGILNEMETKSLFTTEEVIKILERKTGKSISDSYFTEIKSESESFPDHVNPGKSPHLYRNKDIPKIFECANKYFEQHHKQAPIRSSSKKKKGKKTKSR